MLTPEELVSHLNARGCPFDVATYKTFVLAVATVAHRGRRDREAEKDITGTYRPQVDGMTGKTVQQDHPYDPDDVALQRRLRGSLDEHLKLCYAANRWVYDEET